MEAKSHEFDEAEVINKLNEKGILLDVKIPTGNNELNGLVVEYEIYDANDINERFFDGEGSINYINEDIYEVSHENEIVTVINGKLLIYEVETETEENLDYEIMDSPNSSGRANEIAMEFMKNRGFSTDDMKLTFLSLTAEECYLSYSNIFDENYLETSFTTVETRNGKVFKMERTWLDVNKIEDVVLKTIPAKKALMELLMREEVYGKTITDISICYYFDPEKQDYFSRYKEIVEGRTIPAWRIQFSDGYKIILDFE
jgi:cellulose biosynthesis protein BcsQ